MSKLGRRGRGRLATLASYGLLLVLVAIIGAPLLWMISGSLRTTREIYAVPPVWIPAQPRWENFADAWTAAPFERFYVNSAVTTLAGTGLS
jgi:ABC-type glycerol-3-phosphate transport system permease component